MTIKPEDPAVSPEQVKEAQEKVKKQTKRVEEYHPLASLFYLGYAESDPITVFEDKEQNLELIVKFRTLMPHELRDISEKSALYESGSARIITEQLETLARAIMSINHLPLTLPNHEQQEYFEKYKKNPSPLDMAVIVLTYKIKSLIVIDALYGAYSTFASKIVDKVEEAKKKLTNSTS